MAHLAIVGSHSTIGVAALHSELIKQRLVPDFATMFPERYNKQDQWRQPEPRCYAMATITGIWPT